MNHYIELVSYETNEVVETKGPFTEWKANKVDDGMNINLNHEKYFTHIITKEGFAE